MNKRSFILLLISIAAIFGTIVVVKQRTNTVTDWPTETASVTATEEPTETEIDQITETQNIFSESLCSTPIFILPTSTPDEITEITEEPTSEIETTPAVDNTLNYFENNLIWATEYSYTDEDHPQTDGKYYYDHGAAASLISIEDNSRTDSGYIVHSIASDWSVLPAYSIIYINELDLYFRVDDNNGNRHGEKNSCTRTAWNLGCSVWIDIYVGENGYEGSGGNIKYKSDLPEAVKNFLAIRKTTEYFSFKLIRYGKSTWVNE